MDTSKKYIKMCEKAEEIQKQWKPAFNDFACDKDDLFDYFERIKSVNSCADDEYSGTTDSVHYDRAKDMCFWLPHQDQLQEMMIEEGDSLANEKLEKNVAIIRLNNKFWNATNMNWNKNEYYWQFDSFEQLWLAFVMKEKYNKAWGGEKWIKNT